MPELPEVQTTVNGLKKTVKDRTIVSVWTSYDSPYSYGKDNIKDPKFFSYFKRKIKNSQIVGAERLAKNILIHLSNNHTILIHMKMTGHLLYGKYVKRKTKWIALEDEYLQDPFNQFIRLVFIFDNGMHLSLSDMRKFAKVTLITTNDIETHKDLRKLGPDALSKSLNAKLFQELLEKRSSWPIKRALMDPETIAGIGNIYSDEILFDSGINPKRLVRNIKKSEFKKMFESSKKLLKEGIRLGGDSMSDYRNIYGKKGDFQNYHQAYRRTGEKCPKKGCRGVIKRLVIGGRSAHFCDTHQK